MFLSSCTTSKEAVFEGKALVCSLEDDCQEYPVTLYFFWGDGCPHCTNQKPFLEELKQKYSSLEIKEYETWRDAGNAELFRKVSEAF